jgi:hypothetical protein
MAYVNPSALQNIYPANFGAGVTLNNITHPNDSSDNPDDWTNTEQLKLFTWFMKMHHEEDIKGFKAMRDIERSVERAEREEMQRKQWELQEKLMTMQNQAMQAQQQAYANVFETKPTKKPLWKKLLNKI